MSPGTTRGLLIVALVLTLAAAWFAPPGDTEDVALSEHAEKAQVASHAAAVAINPPASIDKSAAMSTMTVLRIHPRRREDEEDETALFAPSQWISPREKTPVASVTPQEAIPSPPQAPPLPFHAIGLYEDAGKEAVFLQYNDQSLVAYVGDTIAEQYKVESMDGKSLKLRYLPLDQLQSLNIGTMQ